MTEPYDVTRDSDHARGVRRLTPRVEGRSLEESMMPPEDNPDDDIQPTREEWEAAYPDHIHDWFSLSYVAWLVLPRLVMSSMPPEWQRKMVALLNELDETFDWMPDDAVFHVQLKGDDGRFIPLDQRLCDYRHGNVEHLRSKGIKTDD